jgi:hypothetical protein
MREAPKIHFDRDWNVAVNGVIVAGTPLRVTYDAERLSSPRPFASHGQPAWSITCCYRFGPETDVHSVALFGVGSNNRDGALEIDVPPSAREIELWFYLSDRWGHRRWDSGYGQNFQFPIVPMKDVLNSANLRFNRDGSITVEHALVPLVG